MFWLTVYEEPILNSTFLKLGIEYCTCFVWFWIWKTGLFPWSWQGMSAWNRLTLNFQISSAVLLWQEWNARIAKVDYSFLLKLRKLVGRWAGTREMAQVLPVWWKLVGGNPNRPTWDWSLLTFSLMPWSWLMKFSADTRQGRIVKVEIMSNSSHTGSVWAGTIKTDWCLIAEGFCL